MKTVVQKIKDHLEWCFKQEDPLYHVSALLTSIDQNAVEKGECYLDQEKEQMINFAKEALKNASENATLNKETQYTGGLGISGLLYEETLVIDKQSILNESNIPTI